jgi:hypothetical protein
LAQGWRQWATGNKPWKDSLETMSWQGFEQEDDLISFWAMKQQSSSTMRLRQVDLTILILGSKGGEILTIWFQNPAQTCNPDKEPSQNRFDDGYEIMSKCIAFGSPVASCYAQSNNITSEQQNLIMTSHRP